MGAKTKGYGVFRCSRVLHYVHRYAWELLRGATDQHVRHRCDNPPCWNIAHLEVGTHTDNMQDMTSRGRARNQNTDKTHCIHGHELTPENLVKRKNGKRECRECHRRQWREWNARRTT